MAKSILAFQVVVQNGILDAKQTYLPAGCEISANDGKPNATGYSLTISKNLKLEQPIFLYDSKPSEDFKNELQKDNLNPNLAQTSDQSSVYISIGENSSVKFVEVQKIKNRISHILVHENASVDYCHWQDFTTNAQSENQTFTKVNAGAEFNHWAFASGSKKNNNQINILLQEEGARTSLRALYLLRDLQRTDFHTLIHHQKPHTFSKQLYKTVIYDQGHGVFEGKIRMEHKAIGCEAFQLNKNLLMGKKALMKSSPQLEIFADDVKCKHGSTTGRLSEDEIFYFLTRAIPRKKAEEMVLQGFAQEIFTNLANPSMRSFCLQKLSEWLGASHV